MSDEGLGQLLRLSNRTALSALIATVICGDLTSPRIQVQRSYPSSIFDSAFVGAD